MKTSKKAVVLASGGFDSVALLLWSLERYDEVFPLYCRQGLLWERAELHWLNKSLSAMANRKLRPLTISDIPVRPLYRNHWSITGKKTPGRDSSDKSVYLPGRNVLMLAQAGTLAAQKGSSHVLLGILKGNPFPDATGRFLKSMERSLSLGLSTPIRIRTPFRRWSKKKVASSFSSPIFSMVFSCLSPRGLTPCQKCNKCAELDKLKKRPGKKVPLPVQPSEKDPLTAKGGR